MFDSKEVCTPIVPGSRLTKDTHGKAVDDTNYKQLVGSLFYLTSTRLDMTYVTSLLSRYMSRPTELHLQAAKRALRYLKGTSSYGVFYKSSDASKFSDFVGIPIVIMQEMKMTTKALADMCLC